MKLSVYSVVAYSGTGKTTLLEKLISELKGFGLRVAAVKHDAHEFELDHEGKDSWRMTKAGADVCVVHSAIKTAIIENRPVAIDRVFEQLHDVDVVLTEGYKHGEWKKIALYRSGSGKPLAADPEDCFAIISDVPFDTAAPCFDIGDIKGLAGYIVADIGKTRHK